VGCFLGDSTKQASKQAASKQQASSKQAASKQASVSCVFVLRLDCTKDQTLGQVWVALEGLHITVG